jgi:hypothetical protein
MKTTRTVQGALVLGLAMLAMAMVSVPQAHAARSARTMIAARHITGVDLPTDPQLVTVTARARQANLRAWQYRLGGALVMVTFRMGGPLMMWTN